MAVYGGFTYNGPGDPKPWHTVENALDQDLIDTIRKDSCRYDADTSTGKDATGGHKHPRLWYNTGTVAIRAQSLGDIRFEYSTSNYASLAMESSGALTIRPKHGMVLWGGESNSSNTDYIQISGSNQAVGQAYGAYLSLYGRNNAEAGTALVAAGISSDIIMKIGASAGNKLYIKNPSDTTLFSFDTSGDVYVRRNIYTTDWTDYFGSSTITGWAATPTGKILYKHIGDLAIVQFGISGTSNSSQVIFTLPFSFDTTTNTSQLFPIYGADGGAVLTTPPYANLRSDSAGSIFCYKDAAAASWSTTSTKSVFGTLIYKRAY